ncbi:OprO/OprP family phosphate-selective porin [Zobellia uliginosa]|uniref:OprO/OprP family phosphate-selective porin n=1 Tax=Zobellia uliginosa TaxID=143224 RepID=UPI001C067098|nr:OprO/OprP family phosphate-selective porin [Zobellia uliginosa]MBU2948043.1 OprO/OprP family phosphate-selective porin [Zobellia uliginosa]
MRYWRTIVILLYLLVNGPCLYQLKAQSKTANKRLLFYLDEDKKQWLKVTSYAQIWARQSQNNPGSTVNDKPALNTTDLSIRRFRLGVSTQPWEKTIFFFQIGVNNLNYLSPKGTSVDVLDAYVEHKFSDYIAIGGGKSAWNGLSRYTSPSSSKVMANDINFIALPTLNDSDDLIRKLGMYAKGKIGKVDYRLVFTKPLAIENSKTFNPDPTEGIARFTNKKPNLQYSTYVKYEFLDPESNATPFLSGSYLGKKRVFNLGIGYTLQPKALWSLLNGEEQFHDLKLFASDIHLDLPLKFNPDMVITAYLGYFNYDFGPGYIRQIGANNPVNGLEYSADFYSAKGNSFPVLGTGESLWGEIGYLFPPMGNQDDKGRLQPYVSAQYSDFEVIPSRIFQYDFGINWYLNGHYSKLTINAQNRPIYRNSTNVITKDGRKWMFVMQYQFRID